MTTKDTTHSANGCDDQGGTTTTDFHANGKAQPLRHARSLSQLFLLRVWPSDKPEPEDWQGLLQQTVTGETRPFSGWAELKRLLSELMLPRTPGQPQDESHQQMKGKS